MTGLLGSQRGLEKVKLSESAIDKEVLRFTLAYPTGEYSIAVKRIVELRLLGLRELIFYGNVKIGRYTVLGKGTSSIVILGVHATGGLVTVKVRRIDSRRESFTYEALMLMKANKIGVGPRLVAYARNAILWKYVRGTPLVKWASMASDEDIRRVMRLLLDQLYAMDVNGIVHHELSRPRDHVLVTDSCYPVIIDFESASTSSRKRNLTQFLQYIIFRKDVERIRNALGLRAEYRSQLLALLRKYKSNPREYYPKILKCLNL